MKEKLGRVSRALATRLTKTYIVKYSVPIPAYVVAFSSCSAAEGVHMEVAERVNKSASALV